VGGQVDDDYSPVVRGVGCGQVGSVGLVVIKNTSLRMS
jgi:hypothetical protein